jgi:hypothetical protein
MDFSRNGASKKSQEYYRKRHIGIFGRKTVKARYFSRGLNQIKMVNY